MSGVVEAVARAIWNAGLPAPDRAHKWTPAQGAFVARSYVHWDDVDMRESDRELFRNKARAAIEALAATVTDEMARECFKVSSAGDEYARGGRKVSVNEEPDERWICCEACGGDGGGETVDGHDMHGPITTWHPCTACAGTGQVSVEMMPITMGDLDDEHV